LGINQKISRYQIFLFPRKLSEICFSTSTIDAEAHVNFKHSSIELSSASLVLVKQIQHLLLDFNIFSSIHEKIKFASNTKKKIKRNIILYIFCQNFILLLKKRLGFPVNYKKEALDSILAKKRNPNIGVPTHKLLYNFKLATGLSGKTFGTSTISFEGTQGISQTSLEN